MAEPVVTNASRVTSILLRNDGWYDVDPTTFRVGPWLWRLPDGEEIPAELLAFELVVLDSAPMHGQMRDVMAVKVEPTP